MARPRTASAEEQRGRTAADAPAATAESQAKPATPRRGTASGASAARPGSGAASGRLRAPLLDGTGKQAKSLTLAEGVFGAELKPHLVHETVRAEANAARAGTRAVKSRGLVAGGRSKPWRQKGTGRARAGTTRSPHWTGGGVAFQPRTNFGVKVNKKERRAALRSALSAHARAGSLGVLDAAAFDAPSTRKAADLIGTWAKDLPLLVIAHEDEEALIKSFRNLDRTLVTVPAELEVGAVVWAGSLLVTQGALEQLETRTA